MQPRHIKSPREIGTQTLPQIQPQYEVASEFQNVKDEQQVFEPGSGMWLLTAPAVISQLYLARL